MIILSLFILLLAVVTFVIALGFLSESLYKKFMKRYMAYFGINVDKIPPTEAVPDPMIPLLKQGKLGGYSLLFLSVVIFAVGLFLLGIV